MKKYFVILILVLTSITLYSQESGWFNNGDHLEQKFVLDSLTKLHCTKDGKQFYTYHQPNTINIWDMESGKILKTLSSTGNNVWFSSDDNSYITFNFGIYNNSLLNIYVKDFAKDSVLFFYDIFYPTMNLKWDNSGRYGEVNGNNYLQIDYKSDKSKLFINLNFLHYYDEQYTPSQMGTIWNICGTNGFVFYINDTISFETTGTYKNSNIIENQNFIYSIEHRLVAETGFYRYNSSNKYVKIFDKSTKKLNYIILEKFERLNSQNFKNKFSNSEMKIEVFEKSENSSFIRNDSIIYYIDLQNIKIIDSLKISNIKEIIKITSLKNFLVTLNPNSSLLPKYFYYYNLDTKKLTDSIACNFNATNFDIVPKTDKIIAWDNSGHIQLLNGNIISDLKESSNLTGINIKFTLPNILIKFNQDFETESDLMIYDILGNLVYKRIIASNQKEVIFNTDDLNLLDGFYIVTIKNQGVLKSVPLVIY